jgi:hypothetical protein
MTSTIVLKQEGSSLCLTQFPLIYSFRHYFQSAETELGKTFRAN